MVVEGGGGQRGAVRRRSVRDGGPVPLRKMRSEVAAGRPPSLAPAPSLPAHGISARAWPQRLRHHQLSVRKPGPLHVLHTPACIDGTIFVYL